ncbi:stomatin-like protein 2, mitochondrial isoform X1 [Hylaeus volcanicus]|uniref:stomatin-like protein 2, mitochondrial isoform X1 n=1 Tax=Hylaeus volcanicus TaxID=313075 RepID=UPI0023B82DAC|nr:stomatin-like protein 2, mitochondrial isoform X1 [Hylaeus volcanicus]
MMFLQGSRSLYNSYASRLFRCNFKRCISYAHQSNQIQLTKLGNVFYVVPEQVACIVERFGKFQRILHPGLHLLIPFVDRVSYTHSLKEETIAIKDQSAITKDNVTIQLDGVLYLRVDDPYNASYGVEHPAFAVTQLAQTTMRSELGKLTLDETFLERETLNVAITKTINAAAEGWGMRCMRYEIRDIIVPSTIRNAMERQAEAERRKRADILQSEGEKQTEINISEGRKQALILQAQGEAEAVVQRAQSTAKSLLMLSDAIKTSGGHNAVAMQLAEQYIDAFGKLAKESNTLIIPANPHDFSSLITQVTSVFQKVSHAVSQSMPITPKLETSSKTM